MEHAFDTEYWDQIWRSGRGRSMATTQPNPHLVRLISTLAPGVALEAGCGAGAEASVSAADVVARLSPDRWDIVSAEEPSRTLIGPDSRETVIHDVVVMARSRG